MYVYLYADTKEYQQTYLHTSYPRGVSEGPFWGMPADCSTSNHDSRGNCLRQADAFLLYKVVHAVANSSPSSRHSTTNKSFSLTFISIPTTSIIKMKFTIAFASLLALAAAAPAPSQASTDACLLKRDDGNFVVERGHGCGFYEKRSEASTDACLLKREADGTVSIEERGHGCGYYGKRTEASTDACLLKREADGRYTIEERGYGCGYYNKRSEASTDACLLKREADGKYVIEERGYGCGYYN
ncbi:hypothetical protein V8C42DRAFT_318282 [Trichoderma barbatum]